MENVKSLPLGLSDFEKIIKQDAVYADKTKQIYQIVSEGDYYFLSRPRRFGKSLLISTLQALFSGKKELFKKLWIYTSDYTWLEHPVIKIDFSDINYSTQERLELGLLRCMQKVAAFYGVSIGNPIGAKEAFSELIDVLSVKNKVVVLIDEYDKPIADHINNPKKAEQMRTILRDFYWTIKAKDARLQFVFLTGVSKFSKTSLFSGINNLRDITLSEQYATLLGYTHEEVKNNFKEHIITLARKLKKSTAYAINQLKTHYDGYRFSQTGEFVFNPYSVLTCLTELDVGDYWFATGTPDFLIKLIHTGQYPLNRIYEPVMSAQELDAFEPDNIKITALLYQSGYLTIKKYNKKTKDYTLDFPNQEVASAFNLILSTSFTHLTSRETKNYAQQIAQKFIAHDMAGLQETLQDLFFDMPYNAHIKREYDLLIIIFSVFKLIGIEINPEVATHLGRADLVVDLPKSIYIIELKFNKSAQEALEQIKDKKYYKKYAKSRKQITLVGINFTSKTKTISLESLALN